MAALNTVKKFFPNVKVVNDATTNAYVEVTETDVKNSKVKKHNNCAMAVACKRKFHLDGVIISKSVAYLIKGNKARRFKVPGSVAREVVSFDRGAGFSPGKFHLQAPPPQDKMGARSKRTDLAKDRSHKGEDIKKRFMHKTDNVRVDLGTYHANKNN